VILACLCTNHRVTINNAVLSKSITWVTQWWAIGSQTTTSGAPCSGCDVDRRQLYGYHLQHHDHLQCWRDLPFRIHLLHRRSSGILHHIADRSRKKSSLVVPKSDCRVATNIASENSTGGSQSARTSVGFLSTQERAKVGQA
jgi:hypothetical protein